MKIVIDGRYVPMLEDFIESPAFPECPPAALKVLVAIGEAWIKSDFHNGRFVLSDRMLMEATGITSKQVITRSKMQLVALGLLVMRSGSFNGRRTTSYRMTWLPGHNGGPATKEYLEIKNREEARRRIEAVTPKRRVRKVRVTVEFEDF